MTPVHRHDDKQHEDHRDERAQDVSVAGLSRDSLLHLRFWQMATLLTLVFVAGGTATAYKFEREENHRRYSEITNLLATVNMRPDPWTGTNMLAHMEYMKEWNPELRVPNPLDIRDGRRPREVTAVRAPMMTIAEVKP